MIEVEIWSDVVCPFCYIGKKNFEAALSQSGLQEQVKVTYRSFELDPLAEKSQSISIYEALAAKYGRTVDWAKQANVSVEQTGRVAGIEINSRTIIPTNSLDAHRMIHLAARHDRQFEMIERLFKAYFTEGKDIAKAELLREIGLATSLPSKEVDALLAGNLFQSEVRDDEMAAEQLGIRGVPLFLFNGQHAVSGAQPVEAFVEILTALQQKPSQ